MPNYSTCISYSFFIFCPICLKFSHKFQHKYSFILSIIKHNWKIRRFRVADPLQVPGRGLITDSVGKAELLTSWFDSKQSRVAVELPSTCHPRSVFHKFAFRSSETSRLLSYLDGSGSVDSSGFLPLFFVRLYLCYLQSWVGFFRILLSCGVFPCQWSRAETTPIPKGPLTSPVSGYQLISLTHILSKIYERLISPRLCCFMEHSGLFPSHLYAYRKGMGTWNALLDIVCAVQSELDGRRELLLMQLEFSAAFDRVSHRGLFFKLRDAGIDGPILAFLDDFLSERTQIVKLDGGRSLCGQCCFRYISGQCFGPCTVPLYIRDVSPMHTNTLVGVQMTPLLLRESSLLVKDLPLLHHLIEISYSLISSALVVHVDQ